MRLSIGLRGCACCSFEHTNEVTFAAVSDQIADRLIVHAACPEQPFGMFDPDLRDILHWGNAEMFFKEMAKTSDAELGLIGHVGQAEHQIIIGLDKLDRRNQAKRNLPSFWRAGQRDGLFGFSHCFSYGT